MRNQRKVPNQSGHCPKGPKKNPKKNKNKKQTQKKTPKTKKNQTKNWKKPPCLEKKASSKDSICR